jgi:hypothetical protein
VSRTHITVTHYIFIVKDAAVVFFAYVWSLALVSKLVATAIYIVLPRDIIISTAISGVSFMLAYVGAWLLFNKWNARFWIKAVTACGIFVVLFIIGGLIDAAIVYNMPHPK